MNKNARGTHTWIKTVPVLHPPPNAETTSTYKSLTFVWKIGDLAIRLRSEDPLWLESSRFLQLNKAPVCIAGEWACCCG